MLIGEKEERLLRRKFKERHRDSRRRERWPDREEREERRGSISKIEQEKHLRHFQKYLRPY